MTRDTIGGGLISRIIFVVGYGAIKKIAFPFLSQEEIDIKEDLENRLQDLALLSGPFKLSNDFLIAYKEWYEGDSQSEGVDSDKFLGYNSRRALHLSKLCMVLSASESLDMVITDEHFHKSHEILLEAESNMSDAFYGINNSNYSELYSSVLSFVDRNRSFRFSDILRDLQLLMTPVELENILETMVKVGTIVKHNNPSGTYYEFTNKVKIKQFKSDYLRKTLYRLIN